MTYAMPVKASGVALIAILVVAGCSPAGEDGRPAGPESALESSAPAAGTAPPGGAPATAGSAPQGGATAATCVPTPGPLAANASLVGRAGEYLLTMIEEVDSGPSRAAEGSLSLLTQAEPFRQFSGSTGGSVPGVTSPLFGSTDLNVEAVGAVRIGDLSSTDPASPGVLVIESQTGTGPSILLRLGSEANRRELVRFDGGYTVLTVVEITEAAFGGTWSSGTLGPEASGFFCAVQNQ